MNDMLETLHKSYVLIGTGELTEEDRIEMLLTQDAWHRMKQNGKVNEEMDLASQRIKEICSYKYLGR